ncbi:STE/STE7/MEK1 protein kinase [Coprinopsis cinerea okayama7|uniref:STE/STE7/MEK1 protein kinase n=1 Tax=Coprinopsis cinerea (strain Okayama-7 / 130 / ATCC MYA-4618 / FGSC 9003) TaxID=240176 RepID=A8NKJ6_COPC7|nr:STE/STE7/MEK1 protein kinase [Coprinopsis cinerea okayama7\|eukprot:XP_001834469.1 STE/STE7/MEK1 protein kinase [Coprinopsis cinerea okayama7\
MTDLFVQASGPLRTKRNFKGLALSAEPPSPPPPGGKKRPPPLGAAMALGGGPAPLGGLPLLDDLPGESPATGRHSAMQATLSDKLAKLELKKRIKDLKNDDLKKLSDLGQGNGGSVEKVEHLPTGTIMAKKSVLIDAKSSVRKQILRELDIMHECQSDYIISCFGSFLAEPNICICMEFMDKGSFDGIYKKLGPLQVEVVGMVALSVLEGLTYLYDVHRIMHRDIKPSNILFNSQGQIKLCDFGVSGEVINSIANTFVGTSVYMSPERIQSHGDGYSVKSDVWSLGMSLVELALGAFPFTDPPDDDDDDLSDLEGDSSSPSPSDAQHQRTPTHRDSFLLSKKTAKRASKRRSKLTYNPDGQLSTMSIFELIHQIVQEPSPRLPSDKFPADAVDLVDICLLKNPEERQTPKALLVRNHPWIVAIRESDFDIQAFAATV